MMTKIKKRFFRAPAFIVSIVLLTAILSGSLCGLQAANRSQQQQYEILWDTTPIKLVVTNLSATQRNRLDAPIFVYRAFNTPTTDNNLVDYVKDVQMRATFNMDWSLFDGAIRDGGVMIGATDCEMAGPLMQSGMEMVKWLDGYDESVLNSDEEICIIPESWLNEDSQLTEPMPFEAQFTHVSDGPGGSSSTYTNIYPLTVVGTHSVSETSVYCSFKAMMRIYGKVSKVLKLDAIQATLIDNDLQDEVREVSKAWFAEPNPTGEKTPWDYSWYFYYLYALDIDNDQLVNAERTLKVSIMTNEICAYLLFILSAGASFFVGFLLIRQRRREIALMRTLGTSNAAIFAEFALEQMICLLAGIVLGGLFFLWQPIQRLALFAAVYSLGIILALLIFLNTNLLSTLKEAE